MQKKNHLRLSLQAHTILFALSVAFVASPAQAGFKWVEPSKEAPVQAESVWVAPPVQGDVVSVARPQPQTSAQIVRDIPSKPIGNNLPSVQLGSDYATAGHSAPAVEVATGGALPIVKDEGAVVQGFADRVPLSVALRQVLPKDTGFSVASDVSLGTLVSWRGGAMWRDVLKDLLMPVGLSFKEQGPLVQISRAEGGPYLSAQSLSVTAGLPSTTEIVTPSSPSVTEMTSAVSPSLPFSVGSGAPVNLLSQEPVVPQSKMIDPPERVTGYLTPPPGAFPAPQMEPVFQNPMMDSWTANKGYTLKQVFEEWARRAGVEINWQAEYDYPVQASVTFTGKFEDAVRNLLVGFQDAQPQPIGYLYNNQNAGQMVLVIQVRGNNYND